MQTSLKIAHLPQIYFGLMGRKQGKAVVSFFAPLDQVFLVFGSKSFVSPDKYVLRVRQEIPPPFLSKSRIDQL